MPQTEVATDLPVELKPIPPIVRLNIGAGIGDDGKPMDIPGFTNIDRKLGSEAYPLAYPDASVDEIRASHVLEHFAQNEIALVLKDWIRALKPGGILRVAVPNFREVANQYLAGTDLPIMGFIMGGQVDADDYHKTIFDEVLLRELLMTSGLEGIRRWESEIDDCARRLGPCSLNLMGRKPDAISIDFTKIGGILAAPRNGYILHQYCTTKAMSQMPGIEFDVIQSCFWWSELCHGMEKWLNKGKEYILTLDYDSVFCAEDVLELYRILKSDERIDAATTIQARRGCEDVLFSFGKDGPRTIKADVFSWRTTPIKTAHFGCTMFRASSLNSFPHPWMTPVPGKEGRWAGDSGHIDVDMNFWHRWEQAGKNLHLANRASIGHIEEFIKWMDMNGGQILQTTKDYAANGKPAGAWR